MTAFLRFLSLAALSAVLGVLFGIIATVAMRAAFAADIAAVYGAAAGLLASPLLAFALWHPAHRKRGAAIIIPLTAAAAAIAGLATPPNGGPVISMAASSAVYFLACIAFGIWSQLHRIDHRNGPDAPLCESCGYSLRGLPQAERCPECGAPTTNDK